MKILIVTDDALRIGTEGDQAAQIMGTAYEVEKADIVITEQGKLLKDRYGDTEVWCV